ncbi:MAG TPA: ACT domain-containing protein [Anaerolineales bacterium]|nr:ACT domain-containing protein [Anaerolineales bacterium]
MSGHTLRLFPGRYAACRMDPQAAVPPWAEGGGFVSITRTPDELSIVCPEDRIPATEDGERGWKCLQVVGPFAFEVIGVLASLAGALAEAGVPILSVSTYETDFLFVKDHDLGRASNALIQAGHRVVEAGS